MPDVPFILRDADLFQELQAVDQVSALAQRHDQADKTPGARRGGMRGVAARRGRGIDASATVGRRRTLYGLGRL